MKKNKITQILGHDVSWFVDSNKVAELDECSIEHIERLIKDGVSAGDLCVTYGRDLPGFNRKETTGFWHIIEWRNIAAELRNSLLNHLDNATPDRETAQKAVAKFDNEWTF